MSRHHKMASEMQKETTFLLECSLCWNRIEIEGDVTVQEPLEAAKEAHSEGWGYIEKLVDDGYSDDKKVDVEGSVCPDCIKERNIKSS